MQGGIDYYMENARIIKRGLDEMKIETYGGSNAPYIWARFPGRNSWDVFTDILEKAHVVATPGAGFGPAGEEFVRFRAFGHRENILEAIGRLRNLLLLLSLGLWMSPEPGYPGGRVHRYAWKVFY